MILKKKIIKPGGIKPSSRKTNFGALIIVFNKFMPKLRLKICVFIKKQPVTVVHEALPRITHLSSTPILFEFS